MELKNNINNNINNNTKEKESNFEWFYVMTIMVSIIIAIFISIHIFKKENYEIINIANNELIYENGNTIETESINNLKITIDNTRKTPLLIKDSFAYKELLINEEDYNKYFKGE